MSHKIYEFKEIHIQKEENSFNLSRESIKRLSFEQRKLFTMIIKFGYIPFSEGILKLSDKQIVDFWNYAQCSVLKDMSLSDYYNLLSLAPLYENQIPTIKEKETYNSDSYQMTVAWINDTSTGKMATAPKAYRVEGLELFNFEDEKIGSLYPEYFKFYELVENANENWKSWTKTERYSFLENIEAISKKRKILLPNSLVQTLEYIKSNK